MVMEAPPPPQSVGREFVRQYYTLLNNAPTHLHRFYNHQSSFVHGGLDPANRETSPVIGQKQIHQKIQQLNFRDCHAKITQVDAQNTLGNGVVVQVTGELSNAGQPMRRFTQTFVLAAQSPKKYYVHNDIFRYQDEIVSDDECEPESRSENEEDVSQEHAVMGDVNQLNQQPPMPFYPANATPLQSTLAPVPQPHLTQPPTMLQPQSMPAVNGSVYPDDLNVMAPPVSQHVVATGQGQGGGLNTMGNMQAGLPPATAVIASATDEMQQQVVEEQQQQVDGGMDTFSVDQEVAENLEVAPDTAMSNEPKTYATLLKSGGGSAYGNTGGMLPISNYQPQKSISPPLMHNRYDSRDSQMGGPPSGNPMGLNPRNNSMNRGNRNNQPRMPRQDSARSTQVKPSFGDDVPSYEDRRKSQPHGNSSFGDNHQLFLGNLPHAATEDELRDIFGEFGVIVDLRIFSKAANKGGLPGTRIPPNYGFITYDTQMSIQKCLSAKPIYYPHLDPNGTTLNVEEKKPSKERMYGGGGGLGGSGFGGGMGGGPRIGMDNSGPRPPRDNNGPRRGPPGGGNMPRGGAGGPGGGGGLGGGPPPTGSQMGGAGARANNLNRPPNRNPNNTYNNRR